MINILIQQGNPEVLDSVFRSLTTPYTGRWKVRAYRNGQKVLENDGGRQDVNLHLDESPAPDRLLHPQRDAVGSE